MVAEVFAGLGALKSAFDLAKGLKEVDNVARRNEVAIELQEKILGAQSAQASLLERVDKLEKEVIDLKAWDAEKENYELNSIGDGVFAYAEKETMRGTEPAHYLCANCFTEGQKSILQKEITDVGRWTVLVCPKCATEIWPDGGGRPSGHKPKAPTASWGRTSRR
jgi:hypothetical protein